MNANAVGADMARAREKLATALIVLPTALTACEPPEPKLLELAIPPTASTLRREAKVPPASQTPRPPAPNYGLGLSPEGNRAVEDLLQATQFGFTSGISGTPTSGSLALEALTREEKAREAGIYVLKKGTPAGKLFCAVVTQGRRPRGLPSPRPRVSG